MSEQAHAAHGDDHGHHGSEFIQHHYDDAQHQFDSGKLGIWLFLAQEVLFFSALFVAYVLYRHHHPEIYAYAHKYLDVKMGAINTGVLIFSSLTAAWAVRAAQLKQKTLLIACLALTIACACGFLVIKYFEYTHKIHEKILFGRYFDPCVSAGGTPLITKGNQCPGNKSTVVFDKTTATVTSGCFDDGKIDLDPKTPLVQADCKVHEVQGTVTTKDGKATFVEKGRKEIIERCFDPVFGPDGGLPPVKDRKPQVYPCWKTNANPHVCKGGSSGILVEYGDHTVRSNVQIEAACTLPVPPPVVADPFADPVHTIALGQKSTTTRRPMTHADEKAAMYAGPPPEHTNMFFTIYFAMTGLHGIHVLMGVFVFIWLLIRAVKGHFTPDYFGPVDFAALYWHIVDLIWIFLFPLLYLIH